MYNFLYFCFVNIGSLGPLFRPRLCELCLHIHIFVSLHSSFPLHLHYHALIKHRVNLTSSVFGSRRGLEMGKTGGVQWGGKKKEHPYQWL